jgi:hypothetical protein
VSPRRRPPARPRRVNWAEAKEVLAAVRYPTGGGRRAVDFPDVPNPLATAEGCAEIARMILDNYAELPQGGRRKLALDILENAVDFGFVPPAELLTILRRELTIVARGAAKPEFWQAVAIKSAEPAISIRELAKRVGVPWPTIARWQRSDYWKVVVSPR